MRSWDASIWFKEAVVEPSGTEGAVARTQVCSAEAAVPMRLTGDAVTGGGDEAADESEWGVELPVPAVELLPSWPL